MENNVYWIDTLDRGLSKSRNLAIKNAIGDICLIADDDVVLEKDFHESILSSYESLSDADLISFKTLFYFC